MWPMAAFPRQPIPEPPEKGNLGIDEMEWQLLVGRPLVGFRAWQVKPADDPPVLRSVHHESKWPAGEPYEAICLEERNQQTPHLPPAPAGFGLMCKSQVPCGIYACSTPEKVMSWANGVSRDSWLLTGKVALWGRVAIHEYGWRAAWAYPVELEIRRGPANSGADADEMASVLCSSYGVPVIVKGDLVTYHGPIC